MPVKMISAVDFRGLSGVTQISLTIGGASKNDSLILFGENGSGKSSITDALEFGLRGRLSRRAAGGLKQKREVKSFASSRAPGVVIELSNGRLIARGGGSRKLGVEPAQNSAPIAGFEYCPIVIRRHDVESFWQIAPKERAGFFFDYLRDPEAITITPGEYEAKTLEVSRLRDRYVLSVEQLRLQTGGYPRTIPPSGPALRNVQKQLAKRFAPKSGRLPAPMDDSLQEVRQAHSAYRTADSLLAIATVGTAVEDHLEQILASIGDRVAADYLEVTQQDWVQSLEITTSRDGLLSILLVMTNGKRLDPTQVLSEANLDLLALLILVEVHTACSELGQEQVIAFDDVFQSVDAVHRIRALEHIVRRLGGWQLIVTMHDRLWLEIFQTTCRRLNKALSTKEVINNGFGVPITLIEADGFYRRALDAALTNHSSSETIAGAAGYALERLCDRLSVSLSCSVTRRPRDRYTLGDLWPGVESKLRKRGGDVALAAADIAQHLLLRNLVGAHYNEWALAITRTEVLSLAKGVLKLWEATTCGVCGAPLSRYSAADRGPDVYRLACSCDEVPIAPK